MKLAVQKQQTKRKRDTAGTNAASKARRAKTSASSSSLSSVATAPKQKMVPKTKSKLETIVDKVEKIMINTFKAEYKDKARVGEIATKAPKKFDSIFVLIDFTSDDNKKGWKGNLFCAYHIPAHCVTVGQYWILDFVQMVGLYNSTATDLVVSWFLGLSNKSLAESVKDVLSFVEAFKGVTLDEWKFYFKATYGKFSQFKINPPNMSAPLGSADYMYFLKGKERSDDSSDVDEEDEETSSSDESADN